MSKQPVLNDEVSVRILKTAVCPSLSGKSKLTYEIGCTSAKELQLRVVGNSNAGCWNSDWVSLKAIQAAFDKVPRGEPLTSGVLVPIFVKTSQNMPGFFLAILKHAGFVQPSTSKKRCYDRVEPTAFKAEVQALMEGKAPPQPDGKQKKNAVKKAAPAKTPSASTKKTK